VVASVSDDGLSPGKNHFCDGHHIARRMTSVTCWGHEWPMSEKMTITSRCKLLLGSIMIASLGAATLSSGASDFAFFFSRFVPSSIPSKIEAHLDKAPTAKPKDEHTVGTNSPAPVAEPESDGAVGTGSGPAPVAGPESDQAVGTGRSPASVAKPESDQTIGTGSPAPLAKPKYDQVVGIGGAAATVLEKPGAGAGSTILPPITLADDTCLSKQRLATGAVLFKDVCTKEWAINSTSVAGHRVDRKCLRKSRHPNGVVMFKDICTDEWAMNTTELTQRTEPRD
jgi:hypothetical protein